MKKICILSTFIFFVLSALASTKLGIKGEDASFTGIYIKNISTGEVLAENDSQRALIPASVMKSLTAATALSLLGEDFCFETPVYLQGRFGTDGSWIGDLVIESCADPTIDSEQFGKRATFCSEIIDALKHKGIKKITGKIIVKETLSDAGCVPMWEIDDVAWAYGAGLFGFNYRDNVFALNPATGKSTPHVPNLVVTTGRSRSGTDLIRGVFSNHLYAYGSDPSSPKWRVRTTMDAPAEVFAYELTDKLRQSGIMVGEAGLGAQGDRNLVMTHKSPSCREILREMLVDSHNLFAEGMLRAISAGNSRDAAIEKERKLWDGRGVSTSYATICDGSGLSRADRLQPVFISNMLEWMAKSPMADVYVSLFPKVGVDGTVKNLLLKTSLSGKLALKSGSMNGVQCYAGYKLDADGKPTHTVVVLVNSFFCQRSEVRAAIEKLLLNTFAD